MLFKDIWKKEINNCRCFILMIIDVLDQRIRFINRALIYTTPWLCGAAVAHPTPDRKAACSNHVGVNEFLINFK